MALFNGLIGFLPFSDAYLMSRTIGLKGAGRVGTVLQIVVAICVLKGTQIAAALAGVALPLERYGAALVFIGLAIVLAFLARRVPESARRALWIAFGVASLYLFLTFNLLAFLFESMKGVVNKLIGYSQDGSTFVFGDLGAGNSKAGFIFATQVLPTIIFIASIFAVLYYIGVMEIVVRFFAKIMSRFMGTSGAESTSVAASIFMGQTEAPLTIRPFLPTMTMSELMTVMTAGMAHVSGGIMAAYVLSRKWTSSSAHGCDHDRSGAHDVQADRAETDSPRPAATSRSRCRSRRERDRRGGRGAIEGLHLS